MTTTKTKGTGKVTKARTTRAAGAPGKVFVSDMDAYLYGNGTHYQIYQKLGSHFSEEEGQMGVFFAVWAPNARAVHVIGSFNGWNEEQYPMNKINEGGIWTLFIPGLGEGDLYKYCITTKNGTKKYKADPYANWAELRPGTA